MRSTAESRAITPSNETTPQVRAAFLYHNPRESLIADIEAGRAPDTGLFGSNHLGELGIEATVQAPRSQVKHRGGGLLHRALWNLREIPVAWELGDADVACSFWTRFFPLAARFRGRPAVIAFNISLCTTYERSSRTRRATMGAALRAASGIVCLATAQRERLLLQHALDPAKVHMVPLGVDDRFFAPGPAADNGYVLAVGRDMARDYATFAEAMAGVDARAIIVASDRNLIGLELPPNVEVRRDVSYADLRDLYREAACVALPTRSEDFPFGADCSGQTVLLDAMAMARPVIASDRATLSDYVSDGTNALIVPPEDPASLRSAIERVLGDRQLAGRLGDAARASVVSGLTTRHVAQRLAPIIDAAAAVPQTV